MRPLLPPLLLLLPPLLLTSAKNLNYLSPATNYPHLTLRPPTAHLKPRSLATAKLTFTHGLASGDPTSDSVILWTRAVPAGVDASAHEYSPRSPPACVAWQIATDADFTTVVGRGETVTSGEVDYTVKVEAGGLSAWTQYWYRFGGCGEEQWGETVGRTKTLPVAGDDAGADGVTLAVYSCANFAEGHFNAYGMSARKDSVDFVVHLGDYIYEMPFPALYADRIPRPLKECITLRDYRLRHATAKSDPDLQLSHRTFAWFAIWDDHEVADNGWRSGLTSPRWQWLQLTLWPTRMHAGLRAYYEYMPLRPIHLSGPTYRIYRHFTLGTLATLILLDTRYADRDEPDRQDLVSSPTRQILGEDQEAWLHSVLADTNTTWHLLANQVQFAALNTSCIPGAQDTYLDGWSGYRAARARMLASLSQVQNPLFLTGDYHTLWVSELPSGSAPYDPVTGAGSAGVEFATTSVTSRSGYGAGLDYDANTAVSEALVAANPQVKWAEGYYRGYLEITVDTDEARVVYYSVPDVSRRNGEERVAARWEVGVGERRVRRPFKEVVEGVVERGDMRR